MLECAFKLKITPICVSAFLNAEMLRDFCVNSWNRFTTSFALAALREEVVKIYLHRSSRKSDYGAVLFFFSTGHVRVIEEEEPPWKKMPPSDSLQGSL